MKSAELGAAAAAGLAAAGSKVLFGIPGGGNNLEMVGAAEANGIRFILAHTEAAATYMAAAYAELVGIPTACIVTRGPGAASAVNGVAHAWLDRQPVILLSDTVSASDALRISHQRLAQSEIFGPITKWSGVLGGRNPDDTMARAIALSSAPRPGPVHLDFDPMYDAITSPPVAVTPTTGRAVLDRIRSVVSNARRIVLVLGVGARCHADLIRSLVVDTNIPVLQTYKAKGLVPDSYPNVAGLFTGAIMESAILQAADLILMIGVDSVELIPNDWEYDAPVISLNSWVDDSPYYVTEATAAGYLPELVDILPAPLPDHWPEGIAQAHVRKFNRALADHPEPKTGLAPTQVVMLARRAAPLGSIATVDAGAHMLAAMPLWDTEEPGEILISSGLATMGFALPAAIAAAIARPTKRVYCFVGDGGLGMVLAELETVARLDLPITVIVFNDSTLSLIKLKQKPAGHGGDAAVAYHPSDFAGVARALGIRAVTASRATELSDALSQKNDGPILIDVVVDPSSYSDVIRLTRGR
jgi:acetolactate synthase I/II/III large subunit